MGNTINGMSAREWWETVLAEGVMGKTGLSAAEAMEKFCTKNVWRQDGAQLVGYKELEWHFDFVRRDITGVEFGMEVMVVAGCRSGNFV